MTQRRRGTPERVRDSGDGPLTQLAAGLDHVLGRVSMYRLVTIVLTGLAICAAVLTATSRIDPSIFSLRALAATLVVLVGVSVVTNLLLGALVRRRTHTESAVITGLLLWFLYWPTTDAVALGWLALTAVLAQASKYVVVWRARHVLNPAAAGAAVMVVVGHLLDGRVDTPPPATTWWAANEAMAVFVLVGAAAVLRRTGRFAMAAAFILPAAVLTFWGAQPFLPGWSEALDFVVFSTPIVFFAGFMLSEPLTLAPRRRQQVVLAAAGAVVFALPLVVLRTTGDSFALGPFESTYELALLAVNVAAFLLGQRGGVRLRLTGSRELGGDVHELSFTAGRALRARPGQYLELHVPHASDIRGVRRVFTIASPPGASTVDIALRVPQDCSSLKRTLLGLPPGAELDATGVRGDFVWPRTGPVLLVAGGIGVTPFLSQLRADPDRDAVLVYGVGSARVVPYRDELVAVGLPVVLVSPDLPVDALAPGWSHVQSDTLSGVLVRDAVADHASRCAFVSGPSGMVTSLAADLRHHGVRTRTDHFTGY